MEGKVFIIGLDGATWDLIDPWCTEGELPTLNKLKENGTRAVLDSTIVPISPVAWTSFATGMNPSKHGIYDFIHREANTYKTEPYNSKDRKSDTMWKILSQQGKKVGVINVPATYPVDKVNGFMISGYPTPEDLEDFTYPRKLLTELRTELGSEFRCQPRVSNQNKKPFLEEMHIATDYVYKATEYLMNNYDWDLLISVFTGTDSIGHTFWEYMDTAHPKYDRSAPSKFKTAILDIYKKMDKIIAALIKNLDSDTVLMINSDHGFGALNYGVSINNWLLQQGLISLNDSFSTKFRHWMFRRGLNYYNLFKIIKRLKVVKRVARAQKKQARWINIVNKLFLTSKDIDWRRTKVYSLGNLGQLYINLKDREPEGCVKSGKEYQKVVDGIITKLRSFKDPNTNKVIFNRIYKKEEAYPNSGKDSNCPDIIFFDQEMAYSIYRIFEFGSQKLITPHPVWSGIHRPHGIFMAHNIEHVQKGLKIDNISICDIAPTALHITNAQISENIDGRVLSKIFNQTSELKLKKIQYIDKERDSIQKKIGELKGLGKI